MHLSRLARSQPDKTAVIEPASGEELSYRELDEASIRLARLFADRGIGYGDHIALIFDNTPQYFVAALAAQRSGLLWTPVNYHLTVAEAAYIVRDCGARALVVSAAVSELAAGVAEQVPGLELRLVSGGKLAGFENLDEATASFPVEEPEGERDGGYMFYSSGTTGQPKGILHPLSGAPFGTEQRIELLMLGAFGFNAESIYLCPAPVYHAAPTGWSLGTISLGGTVILMDRFEPETALAYIERYHVSHVQFVPTMMVRLLKLPDEVRERYDVSSLRMVVHAAAPCPVDVKRRIIEWLGPIVSEYYAGSEGNCFFLIDSPDWLAHPGSVGRPVIGSPHILDDDGKEVPTGEVGTVWFADSGNFAYHNDPAKTAGAHNARGWSTLGDVGRLDEEGYLYLVDRRGDLILSGGVNIYPQEVENVLALCPAVLDVAVIGVPDDEMGKRVHALVLPADPTAVGPELGAEIVAYCRDRLAHFKCPRSVEFVAELPRTPTGKLLRRLLLDRPVPAA